MHPVLFTFDPFSHPVVLYSYGAMLLTALFAGIGLALFLAGRVGIDRAAFAMVLLWVSLAALAGARLLGVATNFEEFSSGFPLSIFDTRLRGVVAYGGFFGGFVALWALSRANRWPVGRIMDLCAVGAALGIGFARIGCYLSGCCFGCPSSVPWSVAFPPNSPAYAEQFRQRLIPPGALGSLTVHPTQLYESVFGFLLFGFLLWRYHRPHANGQVTLAFFGLYALFRFIVEHFRCDVVRGVYAGLSTSQYIALATLSVVSLVGLLHRRSN